MDRDSSGRFTHGQSGNPSGRPKGSLGRLTSLAKALTEPQTEAIIKRALTEATVLWDQKFVLFFMERIWPRSQPIDDGFIDRLEDLERRVREMELKVMT